MVTSFHIPLDPFPLSSIPRSRRHHLSSPPKRPHEIAAFLIPLGDPSGNNTSLTLLTRASSTVYPTVRYNPMHFNPNIHLFLVPSRTLAILPAAIVQLTAVRGLPAFQPPTHPQPQPTIPSIAQTRSLRSNGPADTPPCPALAYLPADRRRSRVLSTAILTRAEPVVAMLASRALYS